MNDYTRARAAIERHYGDRRAERSQVPLIQHIDEGERILRHINAPMPVIVAYLLHPMFQSDKELEENFGLLECFWPISAAYVMEYRNQANAWLSDKVENHSTYSYSESKPRLVVEDYRLNGEPTPGPLKGVRQMLIADKVQNYKDFLLHHHGTHPRSAELVIYFNAWLKALGVDQARWLELSGLIS